MQISVWNRGSKCKEEIIMHPRIYDYNWKREIKPTLKDLKEKVVQINEAIDSVSKCDLLAETKDFIIKELQDKKAELIKLMHQKIDEL